MNNYQINLGQIKSLTIANLKARYRKTALGLVWVVINPILLYSVQAIVFKIFLKLEVPNYSIFLLGGLLPWIFINSCWDATTPALINSANILKNYNISPLVVIGASILDNFINFAIAFTLLLSVTLLFTDALTLKVLLLPLSVLILFLFVVFSTAILSVLHVFYRDVRFVTNFMMSILYFITPIFYPASFIPEAFRWIINFNPLYLIISSFRSCLYQDEVKTIIKYQLISIGFIILLAVVFNYIWKSKKNELLLRV